MNIALGQAGIWLGFVSALAGIVLLVIGIRQDRALFLRRGQQYAWLILGGAALSIFAMQRALLTDDFSLRFVAEHHSRRTPTLYSITTMWSALEGSILLWAGILAGFTGVVAWRFRKYRDDKRFQWALVTMFAISAFFFALMAGPANPFLATPGPIPLDGPGPNPLLQNHVLVAFHPPILYLGYVGFSVPFAFCIGALAAGKVDDDWLRETRRFTLFSWAFLTAGIILGAWWSYEVLGWGGYWAWDPVENASFIPWLTATAYLHSSIVQQRRGMLRAWNVSLLIATFALTILGTFLTRSGVLDSVHAFSESHIGPWLLTFFGLIIAIGGGLMFWRSEELRTPGIIDSALSREASFLANNVLLALFAFVVLLGTTFPLFIEAINGDRLTIGQPYFDSMTMPIGFALLTLMGVAPLLPWRATTMQTVKERLQFPLWFATVTLVVLVLAGIRGFAPLLAFFLSAFAASAALRQLARAVKRNGWRDGITGPMSGGMIVHVGVIIIAVAFAASQSFVVRDEARYQVGTSRKVSGHTITYLGVKEVKRDNRISQVFDFRIDNELTYQPSLNRFVAQGQTIGMPSVYSTAREDVYLTVLSPPNKGAIVARVTVLPLVMWLWIGGGVILVGCLLAAIPKRRRKSLHRSINVDQVVREDRQLTEVSP